MHRGNARRTANENNFVDVALGDLGIRESLLDRPDAALYEIRRKLVELGARELHLKVFRPGRIGGDKWQANRRLNGAGKLDLGFLCRFG